MPSLIIRPHLLAPEPSCRGPARTVKRLDAMRRNPASSYASSVFPERADCMAVLTIWHGQESQRRRAGGPGASNGGQPAPRAGLAWQALAGEAV